MSIFILTIMLTITTVAVFFNLPYSKTVSEFQSVVTDKILNTDKYLEVFTEDDLENLPLPVQKYFRHCGYLGKPKMSYMKVSFQDVDFKMSDEKTIKIDYVQYNFVATPDRFAFIDSSLCGIPFEGFDSYNDGTGSMKGIIAKMITLFDQKGKDMDRACLVTVLAECFIIPNVALQSYITWEAIDEIHAKATISWHGVSASGIFTFDKDGKVLSFKTGDRTATDMKGVSRQADWSGIYSDYKVVNGVMQPTVLQSIWHFPEGDSIYFNENKAGVTIEVFYAD